ncbi:MAG TPA: outer membrane beta-barrel protein [Caulobacteraceae bacterium]|nr:outer membrane beta-barrel protein [Caulobacteraceae bacterium]
MNLSLSGSPKRRLAAGAAAVALLSAPCAFAQQAPPAPPAAAAPAAPASNAMPYPSMGATLSANPNPMVFDAGPLGKIKADGVLSGIGLWQTDPAADAFSGLQQRHSYFDLSNAQLIINKDSGVIQFYVQLGLYSIPALGTPYYSSTRIPQNTFYYAPQGFLKIAPNASFNLMVGALPTLVGAESTFSFQNMNIERGLLWGQEPSVSKGVQANYTKGPWAFSLALTDGYYSDTYTVVSGAVTYTFKNSDTLEFVGSGNASSSSRSSFATPLNQNNGKIFNLIYTHTKGPWTIQPYLQYGDSPNDPKTGAVAGKAWGGAILTKYSVTPTISIAARAEYMDSSGAGNLLGYGVGSKAWSLTLTPTYQKGIFFARGEVSYVRVSDLTAGLAFGRFGTARDQVRTLAETGIIF